jgi:hypothetical protein
MDRVVQVTLETRLDPDTMSDSSLCSLQSPRPPWPASISRDWPDPAKQVVGPIAAVSHFHDEI